MPQTPDTQQKSLIKLPVVLHGPGALDFLRTVRKAFHLSNDIVKISVVDQVFEEKNTVLYLSLAREMTIEGKELGEASGIVLLLGGTLTLRFDQKGQLTEYDLEDVGREDVEAEKNGVLDLIQHNQLYIPRLHEKVNVGNLIAEKKLFYVQVDPDGKKRLKRTATI